MAFREVSVNEITEVLRVPSPWQKSGHTGPILMAGDTPATSAGPMTNDHPVVVIQRDGQHLVVPRIFSRCLRSAA